MKEGREGERERGRKDGREKEGNEVYPFSLDDKRPTGGEKMPRTKVCSQEGDEARLSDHQG